MHYKNFYSFIGEFFLFVFDYGLNVLLHGICAIADDIKFRIDQGILDFGLMAEPIAILIRFANVSISTQKLFCIKQPQESLKEHLRPAVPIQFRLCRLPPEE